MNKKKQTADNIPVSYTHLDVYKRQGEISAIYIYQNYRKLQKERQKHFVEEQQVKAMKQRLEEAENFYGSIRRVRHEMKNHMTNIKRCV